MFIIHISLHRKLVKKGSRLADLAFPNPPNYEATASPPPQQPAGASNSHQKMIQSTIKAPLLPLTSTDASDPEHRFKFHPIGEIFRRSRSAQAVLGMSMALALGNAWFRFDSELLLSPVLSVSVAFALIAGGVVVLNVKYLSKLFPLTAIVAEKAAIAAIFFAYFAVTNAFLGGMSGIAVVSWICLILCFVLVEVKLPLAKLNPKIVLS